ncbi:MAG: pyridoxal-dependent decarboxylase, partial [Myxococcota bacterium]
RANSITLDPHKSLFIPYGTGALLVRDGEKLRAAHQGAGERYSPRQDDEARIDFCEHSPELSRSCRGLRVWLPLKLHGRSAFEACLNEKLDLARWAVERLSGLRDIEVPFLPSLTVVVFRWAPPNVSDLDALNRKVLALINERGRVHLMGIALERGFYLRMCILSYRTDRMAVDQAVREVEASIEQVQFDRPLEVSEKRLEA